jgi:hypothetical protein
MARRTITTDTARIVVNVDELPRAADWLWGALRADVRDELTGDAPETPITISGDLADLLPRSTGSGLVGLTTVPRRRLSMLRTNAYQVRVGIRAPGYVPFDDVVTVTPQPGFPAAFLPHSLGMVGLHREPTVLLGRTVHDDQARTPVPNATVEVSAIWRTQQHIASGLPPDPPDLVSLPARLYAVRAAGGGRLRARGIVAVTTDDKHLLRPAAAGETALRLSNVSGIAAGGVVLVDALDTGRTEYLVVTAVQPGSTVLEAGTIVLAHPLAWSHRLDAIVQRTTLQPPGTSNAFDAAAVRGDACVLLQSSTGLAGAATVEIFGGGPVNAEHHPLSRFVVFSDTSGFFRLPPLSRVAQARVRASSGALVGIVEVRPDYAQQETVFDVVLQ